MQQPYKILRICQTLAGKPLHAAEPANLVDEKLGLGEFFSPLLTGLFGNLFVGGQEAVCAVAIEAPPPIPRPLSRPLDVSDACAHLSAFLGG